MTVFLCDHCKDHGTIVIDRMILVHCPDCQRGEEKRQQFDRQAAWFVDPKEAP